MERNKIPWFQTTNQLSIDLPSNSTGDILDQKSTAPAGWRSLRRATPKVPPGLKQPVAECVFPTWQQTYCSRLGMIKVPVLKMVQDWAEDLHH